MKEMLVVVVVVVVAVVVVAADVCSDALISSHAAYM